MGNPFGMYRIRRTNIGPGNVTAARIIYVVGSAFALIEVVYILLVLLKANSANGAFRFFKSLAEPLALFFPGLFNFTSANITILVNFGLAAVFWLVVSRLLARMVA